VFFDMDAHMPTKLIVAGKGVSACCIGTDKTTAIEVFGHPSNIIYPCDWAYEPNLSWWRSLRKGFTPWWRAICARFRHTFARRQETSSSGSKVGQTSPNDPAFYFDYRFSGVQVAFNDSHSIQCIWFYFRDKNHWAYNGTTQEGIDLDSTIDDVLKRYGKPTKLADYSYKQGTEVRYDNLGIHFEFAQGLLEHISIYTSKPMWWPAEWPHRRHTPDLNWLLSKPDGLFVAVMDAQASFLEFAREVEQDRLRPKSNYQAVMIQAYMGQFVYLTNIFTNGKFITGTLADGSEESFPIEYLSDWYLVAAGQDDGLGGFTVPYTLSELSDFDKNRTLCLTPFRWFTHRKRITAENELFQLPQCEQCKLRYLGIDRERKDGICQICREGGRRCNCPACGAPLIRFLDQPEVCTRCASRRD
jgi:hypothetical protein